MSRTNPGGGRRRQKSAAVRAAEVLRLHVEQGLTYEEVGTRLAISRQRVGQIVNEALEDLAQDRRVLAGSLVDRELYAINGRKRELADIIYRRCADCSDDPNCGTCDGTGYFYKPYVRMAAIARTGTDQERVFKLLGLNNAGAEDQPPARDFYADLEKLPEEELDKALAAFLVPTAAERKAEAQRALAEGGAAEPEEPAR